MRMRDGRYECQQCGAVRDIPVDAAPRITMKAVSSSENTPA
jgi:hypothetical protein